jgi:hypothetical protein
VIGFTLRFCFSQGALDAAELIYQLKQFLPACLQKFITRAAHAPFKIATLLWVNNLAGQLLWGSYIAHSLLRANVYLRGRAWWPRRKIPHT